MFGKEKNHLSFYIWSLLFIFLKKYFVSYFYLYQGIKILMHATMQMHFYYRKKDHVHEQVN